MTLVTWDDFCHMLKQKRLLISNLVRNFSNLTTWRGDVGQKFIAEDNIVLWVLKIFVKKMTLFCVETFQIKLIGDEIWGKTAFFKIT